MTLNLLWNLPRIHAQKILSNPWSHTTPALFPSAVSGDAAPSPARCLEPLCSAALGHEPAAALQTENENVSRGS